MSNSTRPTVPPSGIDHFSTPVFASPFVTM
jgi:hypothetical protein